MWRKNNGFFLAEVLLSLSAWLIIAGVIFPLIINVVNQSVQLRRDFAGTQALYEILQEAKMEGTRPVNKSLIIDRTVYEIVQETHDGYALMEVCVKYEDILRKAYKKCEVFE
ncbi:phosphatase [Bacillus sp. FJAT-29790]|uniref:phosphatase n=1 Tax=Bacillus sp. FJAT-29790 TaxID=1895002 RepID=UPI001C228932|nr:phosphatase [Bacillus sp. FJAT-29790]MBU8879366.1 phosphatase [Bacillus sp. FJAT-29790]